MTPRGSWWHRLGALARNLLHADARDRDLRADVRAYLDLLTDEKIAAGLSPDAARRAARLEVGSIDAVTEATRGVRAGALAAQVWQDARYAARMLRRDLGFSTIAIVTLALGIGANTAIFSVVHTVLIEPLPYPNPDRLVVAWEKNTAIGKERDPVAPLNYLDWKATDSVFEALGAYRFRGHALSRVDEPEQLTALAASSSLFSVLGVAPSLGRVFSEDEERQRERVVVLSHSLWQRRFGGDRRIVGRQVTLDDNVHTIVGVMPPSFTFPDGNPVDLYSPLLFGPNELTGRRSHTLSVIGRLVEGVSLERARTDLGAVARRIAADDVTSNPEVTVAGAHEALVEDVRLGLVVLFATVGLVLLIACANVASLLIVRASARGREMAMRAALGAGSGRLVRQLLTESVLLGLLGSVAGLAVAAALLRAIGSLPLAGLPRVAQVSLDTPVLLFVTAVAVLTGTAFGLLPALQARSPRLTDATRANSQQITASRASAHGRSLLLVVEMALTLMLLAAAGLMGRSLIAARTLDLGFRPDRVLTAQIQLPLPRYPVDPRQFGGTAATTGVVGESKPSQFFGQLVDRLQAIAGVESVGAVSALPLNPVGTDYDLPVIVQGQPRPRAGEEPQADFRVATTGYFSALRIPILRGRAFTEFDSADHPPVAIINETLARQMFVGADPLGQHLLLYGRPRQIVGVVGAVRHHGFSHGARPEMILPYRQHQMTSMTLVVRSTLDRSAAAAAVAAAVRALDRDQPVYRVRPMDELLADSVAQPRLTALLVGGFAGLALVLALVGVYGVMSYSVHQRAREIAVRVALGAARHDVVGMVVTHSLRHALAGVALGVIGAAASARLIEGLLFGVGATDPVTLLTAAAVLIVAALAATCAPAIRATRVAPVAILRSE